MNYEKGAYYRKDYHVVDHAVTVVGWDDNYAASNFNTKPPANGAWIIKNSWGATYPSGNPRPNGGYYYISYYDYGIFYSDTYFFAVEALDAYDNNYQYDGTTNFFNYTNIQAGGSFAQAYTANGAEVLKAVSLGTTDDNISYTLKIYTGGNETSADPTVNATLATSQSGILQYAGYQKITLDNPVNLTAGQRFVVLFELGSSTTKKLSVDMNYNYYPSSWKLNWTHTTDEHTAYVNASGSSWVNTTNFNFRIKAYTSNQEFTLTALSNNDTLGTVDVSGSSIIASPAAGCGIDSIEVISGNASYVQNGNIISVFSTGDCTIRVNFVRRSEYTLTFIANNTSTTDTAYSETAYALPQESDIVDGEETWEFYGWVKERIDHLASDDDPCEVFDGGKSYYADSDTTFYALYLNWDGIIWTTEFAPPCVHYYSDWEVVTPATCTTAGQKSRTCSVCGNVETETIDALGHDYQAGEAVEATCTTGGYTPYTCSRCDVTEHRDVTDALGHNWGDWTVTLAATCTESGTQTRACSRCNTTDTQSINALGHLDANNDWICERCNEPIYEYYTLSNELVTGDKLVIYSVSASKVMSTTAASNQLKPVSATLSADGTKLRVTDNSTAILTVEYASGSDTNFYLKSGTTYLTANSSYNKLSFAASANGNYSLWKLTVDETDSNIVYLTNVGKYQMEFYNSCFTTYNAGTSTYYQFKLYTIPAHRHTWVETGREDATCTEDGSVSYRCKDCGETKTETLEALGHDWGAWTVTEDATDDAQGTREHTCSRCGVTETESFNKTYTVSFSVPSGVAQVAPRSGEKSATVELPSANAPEGWTFLGWVTNTVDNSPTKPEDSEISKAGTAYTITGNATLKALYTYNVGGTGMSTEWYLVTDLNNIGEGIYALLSPSYRAFNGTINSGNGATTSSAFVFDSNQKATSVPSGICEITMIPSDNGYQMYNAQKGYLYSTAASSGKLAWHQTESSYWSCQSKNWVYNQNKTYLRTYNETIRTYGSATNGALYMAEKRTTTTGTPYYTTMLNEPAVAGYNLTTNGDVLVNAFITVPSSLRDGMYVTLNGDNEHPIQLSDITDQPDDNGFVLTDDGAFKLPQIKPAKNIQDEVTLRLYDSNGTQVKLTGASNEDGDVTYSVQGYINQVLANANAYEAAYPGIVDLCKAMTAYGSYAQVQQNYVPANYSNAKDPVAVDSTTAKAIADITTDDLRYQTNLTYPQENDLTGVSFYGTSLIMVSEMTLRVYFTIEDATGLSAKVNGVDAELHAYGNGTKYYYVDVKNIAAKDFAAEQTVTITDGTNSFTVGGNSVHRYIWKSLTNPKNENRPEVQNLVKSIAYYGFKAKYYSDHNS